VFVRKWTPDNVRADSPMVLLHDSIGCVDLWRDFPEALARCLRRPVLAYDRLGFGRSTARSELPSVDFIREESEVFFPPIRSALGITDFSLFGHSVGGTMALLIASLSGSQCEAVVSESTQAFVERRTLAGILKAKEQFSSPNEFRRLTRWHGDKSQWVLDAWTNVWLSPAFASWSLEPDLQHVQCPVLAIHGELDEYGSVEFPRRIISRVKGPAELVILRGCGHVPHREQRDEVLQRVSRFMANWLATAKASSELSTEGARNDVERDVASRQAIKVKPGRPGGAHRCTSTVADNLPAFCWKKIGQAPFSIRIFSFQ
jgi:pimeloyl-ACP methyl ester carboxylesterase